MVFWLGILATGLHFVMELSLEAIVRGPLKRHVFVTHKTGLWGMQTSAAAECLSLAAN